MADKVETLKALRVAMDDLRSADPHMSTRYLAAAIKILIDVMLDEQTPLKSD